MKKERTRHEFNVPMTNATITTKTGDVEGQLEASGHYIQEWNATEAFGRSTARNRGKMYIADIGGMFGTESDTELGNPSEVYTLCFPLLGASVSLHISCKPTETEGVWEIRAA